MTFCRFLLCVTTVLFILTGCRNESGNKRVQSSSNLLQSSTIKLSDSWARPASKGGNSAAYLQLFNGTNSPDTLLKLQSTAASKTAVHESYQEDGMAGMRPAEKLVLTPDSSLELQPGGFHIMLMNLKKDLTEGDSVEITFNFAEAGSKQVSFPIKLSN